MTPDLHHCRVLVTGAAGFIGTRLCRELTERGAVVVAVVHDDRSPNLRHDEVHVVDLTDREAIRAVVRGASADYVVHLAALKRRGVGLAGFRPSYETNLLGTLDIVEAVIDGGGCRRFVYLSSAEEYGRAAVPFQATARESPLTAYGLSKLAATQLLQAVATKCGFPIAILRATVVYGPGQPPGMFVPSLARSLVAGDRFAMTAGEQKRDLVYVDDVVDGVLRALVTTTRHDGVLHLSAGTPVTIREIAMRAAQIVGGRAEALLEFGALPYRDDETMEYWADNTDTRAILGWSPQVALGEGLRRTIEYYRSMPAGE